MANLVTNILIISGNPDAILRGMSSLIEEDAEALLAEAGKEGTQASWGRFTPEKLAPEPDSIKATSDGSKVEMGLALIAAGKAHASIVDIGLALLSGPGADKIQASSQEIAEILKEGRDWLRDKQNADPFLSGMPAEYQMTTPVLLAKMGLVTGDGLQAEKLKEDWVNAALAAGIASVKAFQETGEFGWYDWRQKHWGTRAFGEEMRVECLADGSVSLRFDSVNTAPMPLISAFAAAHPNLQISGASVEEGNDYAVLFVSDDEASGGILFEESHDRDGVIRAYTQVYGHPPHEEELDEEEEDPEP